MTEKYRIDSLALPTSLDRGEFKNTRMPLQQVIVIVALAIGLMQSGIFLLGVIQFPMTAIFAKLEPQIAATTEYRTNLHAAWAFNLVQLLLTTTVCLAAQVKRSESTGSGTWLPKYYTLPISFFAGVLTGSFATFLLSIAQLLLGAEFGAGTLADDVLAFGQVDRILALLVFGSVVVGAYLEELVFRGLLLDWMERQPMWLAASISIIPWALLHGLGGNPGHILMVIPSGIIFFCVRQYTGHYGFSALCHATANIVAFAFNIGLIAEFVPALY